MTTRTQQRSTPRWVLPFLAALIAALAAILSGTTASASATVGAETRVGAISHTIEPAVGPPERIAAGQGRDAAQISRQIVVATGVAANTAADAGSASNKIFSNRVLQRMAEESGPYHNFPSSFDDEIFSNGTKTTVRDFFNKAKPNLGNDSIQYRLPGELNGRSGTYEIFTRPSLSGRTEMIMHRFFRPDY